MSKYLLKYKGQYRILPEIDIKTNDFPRDDNGNIDSECGLYITCQHGCMIYDYGQYGHREMQLCAYIPSLKRGRNIKRELKKQKIQFYDYDESDEEVMFKFSSGDIDAVAKLLKAKTSGASINPFSTKNLPKSKESMPDEEITRYKAVISKLDKNDMLAIKNANNHFMNDVLAKKLREKGKRKLYDYATEQKQMGLSRDVKLYIYKKGMWEEYLEYLNKELNKYLANKE